MPIGAYYPKIIFFMRQGFILQGCVTNNPLMKKFNKNLNKFYF
ncbi:hypothetical protein Solca_4183 [Solitalea canadensis DSM 3403]|uniref:Uncharacterized protein n=1 Tax=Solitalea canadensis (strain ATCC 29591 / DSM 3403 / JCM 21819 / LMG 8368 / NBRC 15130 / NCIMB 12057 / USAM 9D) TaxID=929556 RepID=H8KL90_SOLCM|nr:hypothetical protein Solca_4183 [Solitalea canadensis DSM 3403]